MHKKIPIPKTMIRLPRNNLHVMRHLISPSYSLRSKQKYLVKKGGAGSSLSSISRGLARAAEGVGQSVGSARSVVPASQVSSYLRRNLPSLRTSEVSSILRQPRSLQTPLPTSFKTRQPVMGIPISIMRRQAPLPSSSSEISSLVSKQIRKDICTSI